MIFLAILYLLNDVLSNTCRYYYLLCAPLSLGEKWTLLTPAVWPLNSVDLPSTPFSQSRTILSLLQDAIMLPDGVNVTPVTASEWPQNLINDKIVDKKAHYSKFRMYFNFGICLILVLTCRLEYFDLPYPTNKLMCHLMLRQFFYSLGPNKYHGLHLLNLEVDVTTQGRHFWI